MSADYLWSLLTRPFRNSAVTTEIRRYVDVLGAAFDELKAAAFRVRRQWFVPTATGQGLDALGGERRILRLPGEADDAYRARLETAYDQYARGGTQEGMRLALVGLGYPDATVYPLYQELYNWHFLDGSLYLDGSWNLGSVSLPGHQEWLPANLPGAWSFFTVELHSGLQSLDAGEEQRVLDVIGRTKPAEAKLHQLVP